MICCPERVDGVDLLRGGLLGPLARRAAPAGAWTRRPASLLTSSTVDAWLEELPRVAAGEQLQRGVHAAVHVAHGGELRDRGLAAGHRRVGLLGRLLGEVHLGSWRARLDLEAVVLLAERVDLVRQLLASATSS